MVVVCGCYNMSITNYFLALLAIAILALTVDGAPQPFLPKQQYTFEYRGVQSNGRPKSSEWSVWSIHSKVIVQVYEENQLSIQLQNAQYAELANQHTNIPWRWPIKLSYQPISGEWKHDLEQPFQVEYVKGQIQKITFNRDEKVEAVNIKKAVAQLLQVESSSLSEQPGVVKRLQEQSIGGVCETLYEPVKCLPQPESDRQWFELTSTYPDIKPLSAQPNFCPVFKTKNYENCHIRPIYQHMTPPASAHSHSKDPFHTNTNRSTIVRVLLDKFHNKQYLRLVVSESTDTTYPYGIRSEELWTGTNQTLVLLNVARIDSNKRKPIRNPLTDILIYRFPTENPNQIPLPDVSSVPKISTQLPGINVSEYRSKITVQGLQHLIVDHVVKIDSILTSPPKQVHETINEYVFETAKVMSLLSTTELQDSLKKISDKQQQKIFYDMLSMTGSNPAINLLIENIKNNQISNLHASSILSEISLNIITPSPKLLEKLFDYLKSLASAQQKQQQRVTLSLSLANLLNQICVSNSSKYYSYPSSVYGQFCTDSTLSLMQSFTDFLDNMVKSSSVSEKPAYLYSLGNLATYKSVQSLSRWAQHRDSRLVPTAAIDALKRASIQYPSEVQDIISPVFQDITRDPEVRQIAFQILIATNPPSHIFEKVALSTWREPSEELVKFVHNTFEQLSNVTESPYKYKKSISRKARAVLPLVKPPRQGVFYSQIYLANSHLSREQLQVNTMFRSIMSRKSVLPYNLKLKISSFINSRPTKALKTIVNFEGLQSAVPNLLEPIIASIMRLSPRDLRQSPKELREMLKNVPYLQHQEGKNTVNASIYTQLLGCIDRFYPIDENTIGQLLVADGKVQAAKLQKLMWIENKISMKPSEIGLTLLMIKKTPFTLSVRGQMSAEYVSAERKIKVQAQDIKPLLSVNRRAMVATISPISYKMLGVGLERVIQVFTPVSFGMQVQLPSRKMEFIAKLSNKYQEFKAFHVESYMYTTAVEVSKFQPLVSSPDSKRIAEPKISHVEYPLSDTISSRLVLETSTPVGLVEFYQYFKESDVITGLYSFLVAPPTCYHHLDIIVSPSKSKLKSFESTFGWHNAEQKEVQITNPITSDKHRKTVSQKYEESHKYLTTPMPANTGEAHRRLGVYTVMSQNQQYNSDVILSFFHTWKSNEQIVDMHVQRSGQHYCVLSKVHSDPVSDVRQQLKQNPPKIDFSIMIKQGEKCEKDILDLNAHAIVDSQIKEFADKTIQSKRCEQHESQDRPSTHECELSKDQYSLPSKVEIHVTPKQQMSPYLVNISQHIDDFVKYLWYPYLSNNPKPSKPRNPSPVSINVFTNPADRQFSVHVQKPYETSKFERLPMPYFVAQDISQLSMKTPLIDKVSNFFYGRDQTRCYMDKKALVTFDNVTIDAPVPSDCYTILVADPRHNLMILAIQTSDEMHVVVQRSAKTVDIKVKPNGQSPHYEVRVNNNPVQLAPIMNLAEFSKEVNMFQISKRLQLTIPELMTDVYVSGAAPRIWIDMSPMLHRGRLGGACGNMDSEPSLELVDIQGCVHEKPDTFYKAIRTQSPLAQKSQCNPISPRVCVKVPYTPPQ